MRILLWPFYALWGILCAMGRLLSAVLGLLLMAVGILLTITLIAAFVGIPLFILGFAMLIRSFC